MIATSQTDLKMSSQGRKTLWPPFQLVLKARHVYEGRKKKGGQSLIIRLLLALWMRLCYKHVQVFSQLLSSLQGFLLGNLTDSGSQTIVSFKFIVILPSSIRQRAFLVFLKI